MMTGYAQPLTEHSNAALTGSRRRVSILNDAADMWHYAHRVGIAEDLKVLHRPRPLRSLAAALLDWLLIGLASAVTLSFGWTAVPLALLVVGNRQRALGNLLHDASHWSLDAKRRRSNVLANLLFCWPLWVSMRIYRDEHRSHHKYLGDPVRDPDYIHDASRLSRGWFSVWLDQLRSPVQIRASLLGHLHRMNATELSGVLGWWLTVLGMMTLVSSASDAFIVLALWVAARATVFHAITTFREISDHVGLVPGSLIGFSRNHPFNGVLSQLLHPHNNGYHLLHHLAPGVPFHAIPRAHVLLSRWPRYAAGEQCDSYFIGKRSAVRSWVCRWS